MFLLGFILTYLWGGDDYLKLLLSWDIRHSIVTGYFEHGAAVEWRELTATAREVGKHVKNPLLLPLLLYRLWFEHFSAELNRAVGYAREGKVKMDYLDGKWSDITSEPIPLSYDEAHRTLVLAYDCCTGMRGQVCEALGKDLEVAFFEMTRWSAETGRSRITSELSEMNDFFIDIQGLHNRLKQKQTNTLHRIDMHLKVVRLLPG